MTEVLQPDITDKLARAGRHWSSTLLFGVLTLLAGVGVLAWPGPTLTAVAVLLGLQLIATGLFRFVTAFASDDVIGGSRALLAVLAALSLVTGVYAARHVLVTLTALALLLGAFWLVNGAVELFMALSHRAMRARGWAGLTGAFSMLIGVVVLAHPGVSLVALAAVLGFWLLLFGSLEITVALGVRSRTVKLRHKRSAAPGR